MAQFVRHFLEDTIGAVPPGLSIFWNDNGLPIPNVVTPAYTPKFLGDRMLDDLPLAGTSGNRGAYSLDSVNADASRVDVQVLTRINNKSSNGQPRAVGARCSGTAAAYNGYFAEVRRVDATHVTAVLVKGAAGADTDLATSGSLLFNAGTPFWLRFECRGTNLKMKIWTGLISDEPGAWTVTVADASIAAAGGITFGGKATVGGAAGGVGAEFLCVGTGTDNAPAPPKTWDEYLAFLALQDTLRCVLVEIDPLGQDASGSAISARICASNYAFRSQASDVYPHICYEEILLEAPKNKRRMNALFRGASTVTYGDCILKNEVVAENDAGYAGRLDAWYSWNWDGRPFRELMGHPTWRRCDFKTQFFGAVENVYRAAYGRIGFKIRGRDGFMQRPLTTATIGIGPNASALRPISAGFFFNVDVTSLLVDSPTLTYQVAPDDQNSFQQGVTAGVPGDFFVVRDSGVPLNQAPRTVASVDAVADTITADAPHGAVIGGTLVFTSGAPPAPLTLGIPWYVKSVPTSSSLTLSASPGGATVDITGTTTGATFTLRSYSWNGVPGGRISLVSSPAGQVTVDAGMRNIDAKTAITIFAGYAGVASQIVFDAYHGSFPGAFIGDWVQNQRTLGEQIDRICQTVGAAWSFTREGLLYLSVLDIPGATPAWSINADDIRNWRTGTRFLPSDVERLGYQKNFGIQKTGLAGSVSAANRDLYGKPYSLTGYAPTETGLEQPANHLLRDSPAERETLFMFQADAIAESQRLYNLYRKTCGTFLFDTHSWALATELGDVINVTHPMDGFAAGKNALVVGINEIDALHGKIELEVFCQIDGQWPVVSTSQPFVAEMYY